MEQERVTGVARFGGAIGLSVLLHVAIVGSMFLSPSELLPPSREPVVEVTLVEPPALETAPEPEPEPETPEQKLDLAELLAKPELDLKPEAEQSATPPPAPEPAPEPDKAPEAAPETASEPDPVPEPAPAPPPVAAQDQPLQPLPVLIPVVEFGEEDSGPEAAADGSAAEPSGAAEDNLQAADTEAAEPAPGSAEELPGGGSGDGGPEAPAGTDAAAGQPLAAEPEPVEDTAVAAAPIAEEPAAGAPAAAPLASDIGALVAQAGETPEVAPPAPGEPELAETPAETSGETPGETLAETEVASVLTGPLVATAPPRPKPPVETQVASADPQAAPGAIRPGRGTGAGSGTGSGTGPGTGPGTATTSLANLKPSRRLFSNTLSGDARAKTAMRGMPREMRADVLCMTELRAQLTDASPAYRPEVLPTFRLKTGNVLATDRAGFRAGGYWYNVAFRCELDEDITKVKSFAFEVRGAVPRGEWAARGFPSY
ncbi:DUF930 domain-containing protein [Pannonibacter sp.]|uniref:DUF930 domain-containing protein n=1 Tax=Pannonibacter sp. TaxID=1906786 RepID=UPI003F71C198